MGPGAPAAPAALPIGAGGIPPGGSGGIPPGGSGFWLAVRLTPADITMFHYLSSPNAPKSRRAGRFSARQSAHLGPPARRETTTAPRNHNRTKKPQPHRKGVGATGKTIATLRPPPPRPKRSVKPAALVAIDFPRRRRLRDSHLGACDGRYARASAPDSANHTQIGPRSRPHLFWRTERPLNAWPAPENAPRSAGSRSEPAPPR